MHQPPAARVAWSISRIASATASFSAVLPRLDIVGDLEQAPGDHRAVIASSVMRMPLLAAAMRSHSARIAAQ